MTPAAPNTAAAGAAAGNSSAADVDKVGQAILAAVNGRTVAQALDAGGTPDNPFELKADPLLLAAGVYFMSNDASGSIGKSEFSIDPDYVTPGDKFTASEVTPPIMPFAFNRGGTCFGGYVTGFPAPDKVETVAMTGLACNAKAVDDAVHAQYLKVASEKAPDTIDATPGADAGTSNGGDQQVADSNGSAGAGASSTDAPAAGDNASGTAASDTAPSSGSSTSPADAPENAVFDGTRASDHDLEMIVYGAYTGAYNDALKHNNYFSSNDLAFTDLRSAIRDALEKEGYGATNVETDPVDTADLAKACADDGQIDLRVAFNSGGTGISVVAVSASRMSAYEYRPPSRRTSRSPTPTTA